MSFSLSVHACLSHPRPPTGSSCISMTALHLLFLVPNSSNANTERTAEKRRAAQLEAQSSLFTDRNAWEGCCGLIGNMQGFLCWRHHQATVGSPVRGLAPLAARRITPALSKHPACQKILPEVVIQLILGEAQASVFLKYCPGDSNVPRASPNVALRTP